jgi:hypothetical protein
MDKRAGKRYSCEISVACRYFNGEETSYGKLLNYSEAGVYLESVSLFKEKSIIFIRVEEILSNAAQSNVNCAPRTITLAEVRWCKKISDADIARYAIGARYL